MTTLLRRSLAALVLASSMIAVSPMGAPSALAAWTCDRDTPNNEFRWQIKSLSDADRQSVDFHAVRRRVGALRNTTRPDMTLTNDTPRIDPVEMTTYQTRARVLFAKMEDDGDVILVISPARHTARTMVVEFGNPRCVTSPFKRDRIAAARKSVMNNCGPLDSGYTPLRGIATVRGVGFWEERPVERYSSPNGFQLWPVLGFSGTCNQA
jgi:hypothetical protein